MYKYKYLLWIPNLKSRSVNKENKIFQLFIYHIIDFERQNMISQVFKQAESNNFFFEKKNSPNIWKSLSAC